MPAKEAKRGRGRPVTGAMVQGTTLKFTPEQRDLIQRAAALDNRTMAAWIRIRCEAAARAELDESEKNRLISPQKTAISNKSAFFVFFRADKMPIIAIMNHVRQTRNKHERENMSINEIEKKQAHDAAKYEIAKQIRKLLDDAIKAYGGRAEWDGDDMDSQISDLVFEG